MFKNMLVFMMCDMVFKVKFSDPNEINWAALRNSFVKFSKYDL